MDRSFTNLPITIGGVAVGAFSGRCAFKIDKHGAVVEGITVDPNTGTLPLFLTEGGHRSFTQGMLFTLLSTALFERYADDLAAVIHAAIERDPDVVPLRAAS